MQTGTLLLFTGKMGAGKSTTAQRIANERNAVLISEDAWLSQLYPGQIGSFDDYIRYASQLRPLVKSHVVNILQTGTDVVMDFPANTLRQRAWFKELITEAGAPHELIYLDVSDDCCLRQIEKRRVEQLERARYDTEAMFREVSAYFEPPTLDEGFNLQIVKRD